MNGAREFIDDGRAPEFFAMGMWRIEKMGPCVRLVFVTLKTSPSGEAYMQPEVTIVLPAEAISSAVLLLTGKSNEPVTDLDDVRHRTAAH